MSTADIAVQVVLAVSLLGLFFMRPVGGHRR
jgi:hypothetical protein